jgi:hypothetical protein
MTEYHNAVRYLCVGCKGAGIRKSADVDADGKVLCKECGKVMSPFQVSECVRCGTWWEVGEPVAKRVPCCYGPAE